MTDAPNAPKEEAAPSIGLRLALVAMTMLATFGVALSQPSGPVIRNVSVVNGVAGNVSYGYAQPSARPSPVAVGKADYLTTDGVGRLWTRGEIELYAGGAAIGGNANGLYIQGVNPHNNSWGGNPVQTGGYSHATGSLPTAVDADGRAVRTLHDLYGRQRISLESATGGSVVDVGGVYVQANDTAQAVGHSVAFEASHAGGVSEVTAKASAGLLKWIHVSNPNTTDVFLQIFNASNPTPGSTTPTMSFCIPGGTGASNRGCYNQEFGAVGVTFSTAITYTITTTASGSTAPGSACTVGIGYK